MRGGQLRDSLTISTASATSGNDGEPAISFAELDAPRGRLEHLTVGRKFENHGRIYESTARITVRWRSIYSVLFTTQARVICQSITFDVVGVTQSDDRRSAYLWLSRVV